MAVQYLEPCIIAGRIRNASEHSLQMLSVETRFNKSQVVPTCTFDIKVDVCEGMAVENGSSPSFWVNFRLANSTGSVIPELQMQ
jgi:hypothetical protein